jgi:ATP-dependent RNA helicase DeaD
VTGEPTFRSLGLSEPLLEALTHLGYERPTPIQQQTIPLLLQGRDVIGQAQTGTGKTAAFGLPLLEYVEPEVSEVQALVLTPTRELCIQVTQALRAYGQRKGVQVVAVFGGAPIPAQTAQLRAGGQVVVGTVGRVMDLMSRHALMLDEVRYAVLDEADEMLDLGFLEDVEKILARCPSGRQTALFSATMPPEIKRLAEQRMYEPEIIKVRAAQLTIDTVEQFYVEVDERAKVDALAGVLKAERPDQAIIFVRTKIGADRLARALDDRGIRVKALHGDMSQGQRDGVMLAFKGGRERLLVATDVAARGLDISGVTHVVNYDPPNSPDVYVHRIGRTGRVGRAGRAITLITPKQRRDVDAIERHANTEIGEWSPGATSGPPAVEPDELAPVAEAAAEVEPDAAAAGGDGDAVGDAAGERRRRRRRARGAGRDEGDDGEPPQPRRRRHTKPRGEPRAPRAKLIVGAGVAHGLEPADVVGAIVDHSHLEGEDITRVRVLERFSIVEVPADRAGEVVDRVSGQAVRGVELRLQRATR